MSRTPPSVSICIPVFNEEENLPVLFKRVGEVLSSLAGGPHELVLVDDGSTDLTPKMIAAFAKESHAFAFRGLSLSRNFGHQAALSAGLDQVRGDVCILMDGDLQDSPESIQQFLELYRAGYDVVYAKRVARKEGFILRFCYKLFYRLISKLSRVPMPLDSGDFSLISRRVLNVIRSAPEKNRYLRGLRAWAGFKQIGIELERAPRNAGESKYGFGELLRLATDGIFSFSIVPIRMAGVVGALTLLSSFVFAVYSLYVRFFTNEAPRGFTATTFLITLFSGTNLLFLGIIGEYIGRIYDETKQRPTYVVDQIFESQSDSVSKSRLEGITRV